MKCTIPGANVKVLARAIHALSRIGDELYVEPDRDSLSFRSVNSSRSAYASFTFNRSFFSFYKYELHQGSQMSSQAETSKCKISMKSCIPVFKSPVMLDRKVENCLMHFEDEGTKLVFEMRCRHGIIKTHYLPVIECETLQVVYTKNDSNNSLIAQIQVFSDAIHHFQPTQEEVTLAVNPQKTVLQSFIDNASNPAKQKHTEVSLDPREFDEYTIKNETSVTFCYKEFRALLQFAEVTALPLEVCFEVGGRPIVFGVKNECNYEASFVLSTLTSDADSQAPTPQEQRAAETGSLQPSDLTAPKSATSNQVNTRPQTPQHVDSNPLHNDPNSALKRDTPHLPPQSGATTPVGTPSRRVLPSPSLLSRSTINKSKRATDSEPPGRISQNNMEGSPRESVSQLNRPSTSGTSTSQQRQLSFSEANVSQHRHVKFSGATTSQLSRISTNGLSPQVMSHESSLDLQVRESDEEDDTTVAQSPQPPPKRMRRLHQFFEHTFDPRMIPGHDVILAQSPQPPPKRMRRLHQFFEHTFDPRMIPGHDVILAHDSGDEDT